MIQSGRTQGGTPRAILAAMKDDTATRILDAAEQHFASSGYAGTTLRGVIRTARVNVAAVAYHFGTKEQLYGAVIERFARPVVERQLETLNRLGYVPSVEAILRAFIAPPLDHVYGLGKKSRTLALFLGRAQTEQEPVAKLVDRHYKPCRDAYIAALRRAAPRRAPATIHWQFEFVVGTVVCYLMRSPQVRERIAEPLEWDAAAATDLLVGFCLNGMKAR